MSDFVTFTKRDFYLWRAEVNLTKLMATIGLTVKINYNSITKTKSIRILYSKNFDSKPTILKAINNTLYREYREQKIHFLSKNELEYFKSICQLFSDYEEDVNFSNKQSQLYGKFKIGVKHLEDIGYKAKLYFE